MPTMAKTFSDWVRNCCFENRPHPILPTARQKIAKRHFVLMKKNKCESARNLRKLSLHYYGLYMNIKIYLYEGLTTIYKFI